MFTVAWAVSWTSILASFTSQLVTLKDWLQKDWLQNVGGDGDDWREVDQGVGGPCA